MKAGFRKIFSWMLCISLMGSLINTSVYATENVQNEAETYAESVQMDNGDDNYVSEGVLFINGEYNEQNEITEEFESVVVSETGSISGMVKLDCPVTNSGTIDGGIFTGNIENINSGSITGGEFHGLVSNKSKIYGGVFETDSEVHNYYIYLRGGTFKGAVYTHRMPISGGTFSGKVYLDLLGTISNGTFTEDAEIIMNEVFSGIAGGTFYCEIENVQQISGGTFKAPVINRENAIICGGTFESSVENYGQIYSNKSKNRTMLQGDVINHNLIYGCNFGSEATVRGDGKTYIVVNVLRDELGIIDKVIADQVFLYGENVLSALDRYVTENPQLSQWYLFNGMGKKRTEIPEDRTFQLQIEENGFIRVKDWEITSDRELRIDRDCSGPDDDWMPDSALYDSVYINGATLSGGDWDKPITNMGVITGGTYSSEVTNQRTISGGTYKGTVTNIGTIIDGKFNGTVTNSGTISNGEYEGIVINAKVASEELFQGIDVGTGKINDGIFRNTVTNNGTIYGGTFTSTVTNHNVIKSGTFTYIAQSAKPAVTNESTGSISGGNFAGNVTNNGTISSGMYHGEYMINNGTISGGILDNTYLRNGGVVFGCAYGNNITLSSASKNESDIAVPIEIYFDEALEPKIINDVFNYGQNISEWLSKQWSGVKFSYNDGTEIGKLDVFNGLKTYSFKVSNKIHSWSEPKFDWIETEDGWSVKATFTCEWEEHHIQEVEATITSNIETPATCTENGKTVYTATVEFEGNTYSDTKEVTIRATGHSLNYEAEELTIKEICQKCDHTAVATLKVDSTYIYTGEALTPAIVDYSDNWLGEKTELTYSDNLQVGTATVSLTLGGVTVVSQFSIIYLVAEDATLLGNEGKDGWYRGNVTVVPQNGFYIAGDESNWTDSLTVTEEGVTTVTYYLRNSEGEITDAKTIEVKIDNTAPAISNGSALKDGGIYCKTVSGGIVETNFDRVEVDGKEISYTHPNANYFFTVNTSGEHTIEVYDLAGNTLTVGITVNEDHTYEVTESVLPTCTVRGHIREHCKYCEASIYRDLGYGDHVWENGVCVYCGEETATNPPTSDEEEGTEETTESTDSNETTESADSDTTTKAPIEPSVTTEKPILKKVVAKMKNSTASSITIRWDNIEGASGYQIYRKAAKGKYKLVGQVKAPKNAFKDRKLKASRVYTYKVLAFCNVNGRKVFSDFQKVKATTRPMKTKVKVSVVKGKIRLTWKNIRRESGYIIYRKIKGGKWKKLKTTKANVKTFLDKTVKKGRTYSYRVKGYRKLNGKKLLAKASKIRKVTVK